ncbi:LPXTG cell wall anchor domain-containing protein [Actinoplanes sp. NPDC026623]|uniref:LPXTG cell wall anchor domain-containing protein n=1 Tax=Actinoplanes sp. NPDC026623 TaxID=3155610 RepID=UPI0033C6A771
MNLKSQLRRTAVLTAGALIGLSGAFVLAGPASAHHSTVTGVAECDTVAGDWKVTWTVNAASGGHSPTYKWTKVELTPAGVLDNPKLKVDGTTELTDDEVIVAVQHVPTTQTSTKLAVAAVWKTGDASADGTVNLEGKCEKTPTDDESTPPEVPADLPGEPEPVFELDCTTMTIGLDNPADGVEFKLHYKTTKGEERDLTIKPGEKKSEKFSAKPGFKVDVTFSATVDGESYSETETIAYEQPADCDDSGSGGGLPVTGAAAGSIAGGAAVLLIAGVGLFFMARRRKVKFTA